MYTVVLKKVKIGMVLANDVLNQQGVLLLTKGTILNEKNIWMLKSWGILEVIIEGEPDREKISNLLQEDQKKAIENELKNRFLGALDNEVMTEIMRVAAKQLHRRLLTEKKAE